MFKLDKVKGPNPAVHWILWFIVFAVKGAFLPTTLVGRWSVEEAQEVGFND